MIKIRSETRALVASLATIGLPALNAAHAESKSDSCFAFGDNQQITLRGQIVQSATTEESEGEPPHKYMAIVLDHPICFARDMSEKITLIEVGPVPIMWLGHYVVITGNMEAGDSWGGSRSTPGRRPQAAY